MGLRMDTGALVIQGRIRILLGRIHMVREGWFFVASGGLFRVRGHGCASF